MACGKRVAAERGAWLCFEDEAGQARRPPKVRTWGRRGCTPVAVVSGKGSGRVSIAGLVCVRPGERARLIYRTRLHRGRAGERRSFSEADYAALLDAAHRRLGGPIVLVWDNLNTHRSAVMNRLLRAREWLYVVRLPGYAPELNPVEQVWSHIKRGLGNLLVWSLEELAGVVKNRLNRVQYRPELLEAFVAHTGLDLEWL